MKHFELIFALALVSFVAGNGQAGQSPVTPVKFDVIMKMQMGKAKAKMMNMPMNMTMKVWIQSKDKMRIEVISPFLAGKMTGVADRVVMVLDGANLYMINDLERTATKMKSPADKTVGMVPGPIDPTQTVMDNKTLEKMGFKKTGTSTIGKDKCNVYKGKTNQHGRIGDLSITVRESDSFPLAFVYQSNNWMTTGEFTKIEKNPKMAPWLFKIPPGYKVLASG